MSPLEMFKHAEAMMCWAPSPLPVVVVIRYEYLGSVRVDGLCPGCFLPSLVESVGAIIGPGMMGTRIRHCTDCGWGLP